MFSGRAFYSSTNYMERTVKCGQTVAPLLRMDARLAPSGSLNAFIDPFNGPIKARAASRIASSAAPTDGSRKATAIRSPKIFSEI